MSTPTKVTLLSGLLGTLFVVGAAIAPAQAQTIRTWVSGAGDDANPCSRTAPCKTWAHAMAETDPGGEINALDPGGFGAMTITQSVTVDGGGGMVASTLVAGMAGIVVNASSTDVVVIRNVRFDGVQGNDSTPGSSVSTGSTGTIGIQVVSAERVVIENAEIVGFSTGAAGSGGIVIAPSSGTTNVSVQTTSAYNNQVGLLSKPTGGATVYLTVEHSYFDNNIGGGIRIDGTGSGNSNVVITDTSMSLNGGNGVVAISGSGGNTNVDLMRDVIAGNAQNGVVANNNAGGAATVTAGSSILSYNQVDAWSIVNTATILSFKNNQVSGPTVQMPSPALFQ
jgi:hypothetical protein